MITLKAGCAPVQRGDGFIEWADATWTYEESMLVAVVDHNNDIILQIDPHDLIAIADGIRGQIKLNFPSND